MSLVPSEYAGMSAPPKVSERRQSDDPTHVKTPLVYCRDTRLMSSPGTATANPRLEYFTRRFSYVLDDRSGSAMLTPVRNARTAEGVASTRAPPYASWQASTSKPKRTSATHACRRKTIWIVRCG